MQAPLYLSGRSLASRVAMPTLHRVTGSRDLDLVRVDLPRSQPHGTSLFPRFSPFAKPKSQLLFPTSHSRMTRTGHLTFPPESIHMEKAMDEQRDGISVTNQHPPAGHLHSPCAYQPIQSRQTSLLQHPFRGKKLHANQAKRCGWKVGSLETKGTSS